MQQAHPHLEVEGFQAQQLSKPQGSGTLQTFAWVVLTKQVSWGMLTQGVDSTSGHHKHKDTFPGETEELVATAIIYHKYKWLVFVDLMSVSQDTARNSS